MYVAPPVAAAKCVCVCSSSGEWCMQRRGSRMNAAAIFCLHKAHSHQIQLNATNFLFSWGIYRPLAAARWEFAILLNPQRRRDYRAVVERANKGDAAENAGMRSCA